MCTSFSGFNGCVYLYVRCDGNLFGGFVLSPSEGPRKGTHGVALGWDNCDVGLDAGPFFVVGEWILRFYAHHAVLGDIVRIDLGGKYC